MNGVTMAVIMRPKRGVLMSLSPYERDCIACEPPSASQGVAHHCATCTEHVTCAALVRT